MKTIGIIGLLLLAAIVAILGIMASADAVPPPIIEVEPVILVEPITEFAPLIDVTFDPSAYLPGNDDPGPRYTEDMVRAVMRNYDYPWPVVKPLKIQHQSGRIWYVFATFQNTTRLYIFDEPL